MTHLKRLIERYPVLAICETDIQSAFDALVKLFTKRRRLYVCGNGGSASDALHIVGELAKSFCLKRPLDEDFTAHVSSELAANLQGAFPAFALVENTSLTTAFANDCDPEYIYAQQVYAYARAGDGVLGISTSGNSKNVAHAIEAARGRGAITMGLTGKGGGKLKKLCDVCIRVPERETYKIQELHLPVYHALCLALEEHFWGENLESRDNAELEKYASR
jgi:D-sedoheptulose 7-phosphate isomerase